MLGEGRAGVTVDQGVQQLRGVTLRGPPFEHGAAEPFAGPHPHRPAVHHLAGAQIQHDGGEQIGHGDQLAGEAGGGAVGEQGGELGGEILAEADAEQLRGGAHERGQRGAGERQGGHPAVAVATGDPHPMTQVVRGVRQGLRDRGRGVGAQAGEVLERSRPARRGLLAHPEGGAQVVVDDEAQTTQGHGIQPRPRG